MAAAAGAGDGTGGGTRCGTAEEEGAVVDTGSGTVELAVRRDRSCNRCFVVPEGTPGVCRLARRNRCHMADDRAPNPCPGTRPACCWSVEMASRIRFEDHFEEEEAATASPAQPRLCFPTLTPSSFCSAHERPASWHECLPRSSPQHSLIFRPETCLVPSNQYPFRALSTPDHSSYYPTTASWPGGRASLSFALRLHWQDSCWWCGWRSRLPVQLVACSRRLVCS